MIKSIIPEKILMYLSRYNYRYIYELRFRRNCPIIINYNGINQPLLNSLGEQVFVDRLILEYILKKATENSLYAYNNQLKQGFITTKGGVRIGVSGESVNSDNFLPTTIKNISSINIRVPHEVIGCSSRIFNLIYNKENGLKNTLIISPPGAGKTTFLRDVAKNISKIKEKIYNTLVVDERFEIAACNSGEVVLDVGCYTDVVSGANKMYAFTNAIRSMGPDVIITDELMGEEDLEACMVAIKSGVKVIASVHSNNHRELFEREEFKNKKYNKLFDRYIILSKKDKPGVVEGVFDENLNCIYF